MNSQTDPNVLPTETPDQREERPKFIPTDEVEQVVLGECFWNNKTSWGYNVRHNGVDKVWFVKKAGHDALDGYPAGQQLLVNIQKKEGQQYGWLNVRQAIFDEKGDEAPPPDPTVQRREKMRKVYLECLWDAWDVAAEYNDKMEQAFMTPEILEKNQLGVEDIRQIATSFAIQRDRKNW